MSTCKDCLHAESYCVGDARILQYTDCEKSCSKFRYRNNYVELAFSDNHELDITKVDEIILGNRVYTLQGIYLGTVNMDTKEEDRSSE